MKKDNIYTHLGYSPEGYEVSAATDSAGSQVIVRDTIIDESRKGLHLLSPSLKNHQKAIALGKRVVRSGVQAYNNWYDLREPGMDLFALAMSIYARPLNQK